MKYSIGYKIFADNKYIDFIIDNKSKVYEVYFAWGDLPNGRNNQLIHDSLFPWQAQSKQIADLKCLSEAEIPLNLLLNGNCYGKDSLSRAFFNKIGDIIDYAQNYFLLKSITTTSPIIARFVKENFPNLRTRASVNMKIGTIQGMDYVAEYFDGYYLQREYNRNIKRIKTIKQWCDQNEKELFLLANSGCLNFCSAHTFHDNLVAHETEIAQMDNAYKFQGQCQEYMTNPEKHISLIRDTSFIRPEDIHLFDDYFVSAKLATRVSENPIKTLKAYFAENYSGNIADILEPNHSASLYPKLIENKKIDSEFTKKVLNCNKDCQNCLYCKTVFENATIDLSSIGDIIR